MILSSDVGPIPLTYTEKFPCYGYGVRKDSIGGVGLGFVATRQYPYNVKWDPFKFNLGNSILDLTSVFASFIALNELTFGAKAAKDFNKGGQTLSGLSLLKSLRVDQTPNSIILAGGGLIPGPVGGGFALASLFYDLGFYTIP